MKSMLKKIGLIILALAVILFLSGFIWFRFQVHVWKKAGQFYKAGEREYDAGKYDLAISNFNESIRLNRSSSSYYNMRALVKDKLDDFSGAIEDMNKAIQINPTNDVLISNRGMVNFDLGNYNASIADFSSAITLNPDNGTNYFYRGIAKSLNGDKVGALADVNKAVELAPQYDRALKKRDQLRTELQGIIP